MIDKVTANLPPELRVMAEGLHMTLTPEQQVEVDKDLVDLYDAMLANNEVKARTILNKWNVPPQCYAMLALALANTNDPRGDN